MLLRHYVDSGLSEGEAVALVETFMWSDAPVVDEVVPVEAVVSADVVEQVMSLFLPFGGEDKKEGAKSFADALKGSGEITSQKILSDLGKIDNDLPMKTEIKSPVATTLIDLMAVRGVQLGYFKTAMVLKAFNVWYRVNMVSNKRQGRAETVDAFKAIYVEELRKLSAKDNDVFGASRK